MKAPLLIAAAVLFSLAPARALEVVESGGNTRYNCTARTDIVKSLLQGFIAIQLADGQSLHLPVAQIAEVRTTPNGVMVVWKTARTGNGSNFVTTSVFVPVSVMRAEELFSLLSSAR